MNVKRLIAFPPNITLVAMYTTTAPLRERERERERGKKPQ
jgi:hypothetical protein